MLALQVILPVHTSLAVDRHSARSARTFLVGLLAWLMARPKAMAHSRMPLKLALARAEMGC